MAQVTHQLPSNYTWSSPSPPISTLWGQTVPPFCLHTIPQKYTTAWSESRELCPKICSTFPPDRPQFGNYSWPRASYRSHNWTHIRPDCRRRGDSHNWATCGFDSAGKHRAVRFLQSFRSRSNSRRGRLAARGRVDGSSAWGRGLWCSTATKTCGLRGELPHLGKKWEHSINYMFPTCATC